MKGPYNTIVASTKAQAEGDARIYYNQAKPNAVLVGPSRDGRKTYRVYDLNNENVSD